MFPYVNTEQDPLDYKSWEIRFQISLQCPKEKDENQ